MPRISENTIEHIRSTADIVEVISSYIELKKRGRNFFGLCPFHGEKTPSFSVNAEKQIFKCFGCGEGGGVINFLMLIDNIDFIEATTKLGKMYNIQVLQQNSNPKTKNLKSQLLEINLKAKEYYIDKLNDPNNKKIKEYLKKRGFNSEILSLFKLGFSDNKSKGLLEYFRKLNLNSKAMVESGLFYEYENKYYDRFKSRLIFPINDKNGDTIAFAGRIIDNNNKMAKYINSPETLIYNKSKTFYGLDIASNSIREKKSVILVEGYFDLMRLVQNNIKNVVAISGTSFTDNHATIIKQYTTNLYIAFDGDIAGNKAAIRTGYILLRNSISPKIIEIPEKMDPDDLIETKGVDIFLEAFKKAKNTIGFHYNFYKKENKNSINDFINESLEEIVTIKEPIFRELSGKELAEETNLSEENIFLTLNKIIDRKNRFKSKQKSNDVILEETSKNMLEDDLIRLCLNKDTTIRKFIYENMKPEWFKSVVHKEIFNQLFIHLISENDIPITLLINQITDNDIRNKLIDLSINIEKFTPTLEMAKECIVRFEEQVLKIKLNELRNNLKSVNNSNMVELLKEITKIEKKINELLLKYN